MLIHVVLDAQRLLRRAAPWESGGSFRFSGTVALMQIERTPLAQQEFDAITDGLDRSEEPTVTAIDSTMDMFADDTPLECGLENPDICESCQ